MPTVPLCQHLKINGKPCGAPALRNRRFCYFHDESRKRRRASEKRTRAFPTRHNCLDIPILEDANAIQVGLMETIDALIGARITERQCGLILYALQTASANLKRTTFETDAPEPAEPWVDEILTALRALPNGEANPDPALVSDPVLVGAGPRPAQASAARPNPFAPSALGFVDGDLRVANDDSRPRALLSS